VKKNQPLPRSVAGNLVRKHKGGTQPEEGTLDTREKIDQLVERLTAATEEKLQDHERARQESAAWARNRRVG
jgi:hypothetical protein